MIYVYYRVNCRSSKKTFAWFTKYNIEIQKLKINKITKKDLLFLLESSNNGIYYIIKRPGKNRLKVTEILNEMMEMTLNEALDFLLSNSEIIPTPIIIGDKNCLIGYNEDEIRQFLPKKLRREKFVIKQS